MILIKTQTLKETRDQFYEIIDEINTIQLQIDENSQPNFQAIDSFDDLYCRIVATEKSLNKSNLTETRIDSKLENTDMSDVKPKIKLPTLELPGFSGDVREWPIFYESFKINIHENEHLTDSE